MGHRNPWRRCQVNAVKGYGANARLMPVEGRAANGWELVGLPERHSDSNARWNPPSMQARCESSAGRPLSVLTPCHLSIIVSIVTVTI